jgi:transposase
VIQALRQQGLDWSGFWLSDEQLEGLRPLLPDKLREVARVDDRRVISGIIHVVKSGGRWVDAPACYGPKKTLCNRFVRWADPRAARAYKSVSLSSC